MNWQVVKWDIQPSTAPVEEPVVLDKREEKPVVTPILENVIVTVYWKVSQGASSRSGSTSLTPPAAESYTPLSELNEEQVLGWVFAAMGPEGKALEESML